VDNDFQQRYRAAELAYGAGDYTEAGRIAGALLNELEATPEDPEAQIAARGWRAFVALLLANVELYGLNHAGRAADLYRLVLDNQPHETLAGLAEQGLKRARSIPDEPTPVQQEAPFQQTTPDPVSTGGNLLRDPFLKDQNFSNSSSTSPRQLTSRQQPTSRPQPCHGLSSCPFPPHRQPPFRSRKSQQNPNPPQRLSQRPSQPLHHNRIRWSCLQAACCGSR
jgi:hypothetical protein